MTASEITQPATRISSMKPLIGSVAVARPCCGGAWSDEAAAQPVPALDNPQIEILYSPPNASFFTPIYERYKKRQVARAAQAIPLALILPDASRCASQRRNAAR